MADFPIKIRADLEGKGLKECNQEFKDLQKETKAADAQIVQTAASHEDAGKKGEEAGKKQVEGAHKAELSHRELRESVGAVARQFGGLADVGLWLSPVTAALAIVLVAVEAVKNMFENLRARIDAAASAFLAIDASRMKAAADAASDTATSLGEIADKESAMQATFDRGNTLMENRIKLYNDEKDGVVKVAEAEEKAFEERMKYQSDLDPTKKEQNDALIQQARLGLDSLRGQNDAAKLQNEIHERSVALATAQYNVSFGVNQKKITEAAHAEKGPKEDAAAAKTELELAQKEPINRKDFGNLNLEDAKKQLLELQHKTELEKIGGYRPETVASDNAQKERLQKAVTAQEERLQRLQDAADAAEVAAKHAKQQTDNAKADADADQKRVIEEPARIDTLQKELGNQASVRARVQNANAEAAQSRAGSEHVEAATKALDSANELVEHIRSSSSNAEEWQKMEAAFSKLANVVGRGQGLSETMMRRIDELETKHNQLEQWHTRRFNGQF